GRTGLRLDTVAGRVFGRLAVLRLSVIRLAVLRLGLGLDRLDYGDALRPAGLGHGLSIVGARLRFGGRAVGLGGCAGIVAARGCLIPVAVDFLFGLVVAAEELGVDTPRE